MIIVSYYHIVRFNVDKEHPAVYIDQPWNNVRYIAQL